MYLNAPSITDRDHTGIGSTPIVVALLPRNSYDFVSWRRDDGMAPGSHWVPLPTFDNIRQAALKVDRVRKTGRLDIVL